jgi:hypothetical protein
VLPINTARSVNQKTTISNLIIVHFPCIVSLCYKRLCPHVRQYRTLLFYIMLCSEQKCVAGNIMQNSTVYCLINVCSCFVMILKFCIFSIITHSRIWRGVVMVWRVATLPMLCYIVRKITTRRMPQSYACYLWTSQPLVAL